MVKRDFQKLPLTTDRNGSEAVLAAGNRLPWAWPSGFGPERAYD